MGHRCSQFQAALDAFDLQHGLLEPPGEPENRVELEFPRFLEEHAEQLVSEAKRICVFAKAQWITCFVLIGVVSNLVRETVNPLIGPHLSLVLGIAVNAQLLWCATAILRRLATEGDNANIWRCLRYLDARTSLPLLLDAHTWLTPRTSGSTIDDSLAFVLDAIPDTRLADLDDGVLRKVTALIRKPIHNSPSNGALVLSALRVMTAAGGAPVIPSVRALLLETESNDEVVEIHLACAKCLTAINARTEPQISSNVLLRPHGVAEPQAQRLVRASGDAGLLQAVQPTNASMEEEAANEP